MSLLRIDIDLWVKSFIARLFVILLISSFFVLVAILKLAQVKISQVLEWLCYQLINGLWRQRLDALLQPECLLINSDQLAGQVELRLLQKVCSQRLAYSTALLLILLRDPLPDEVQHLWRQVLRAVENLEYGLAGDLLLHTTKYRSVNRKIITRQSLSGRSLAFHHFNLPCYQWLDSGCGTSWRGPSTFYLLVCSTWSCTSSFCCWNASCWWIG